MKQPNRNTMQFIRSIIELNFQEDLDKDFATFKSSHDRPTNGDWAGAYKAYQPSLYYQACKGGYVSPDVFITVKSDSIIVEGYSVKFIAMLFEGEYNKQDVISLIRKDISLEAIWREYKCFIPVESHPEKRLLNYENIGQYTLKILLDGIKIYKQSGSNLLFAGGMKMPPFFIYE